MDLATNTLPDDLSTTLLDDLARRNGVGPRTMQKRLQAHGCPVIAVSPRRKVVRNRDYAAFLKAREL